MSVVVFRANDFPLMPQFSQGLLRTMRAYAALSSDANEAPVVALSDMRQSYARRDRLRKRGPLSQRGSVFLHVTREHDYSPRVGRPLLRDLTSARRQIMARSGMRVPPPSPVTAPGRSAKGVAAAGGGRGGAALSRARDAVASQTACRPFATTAPRYCTSCKKLEV